MANSKSQKLRETALPYPYRGGGLSLEVEEYHIEGEDPVELDTEPGEATVDLAVDESDPWSQATIQGSITLPREVIDSVFPSNERNSPPGKLYVAIRCRETIYRDRVDVYTPSEEGIEPGEHDFEVVLDADNLRGSVELHPYLVRSSQGEGEDPFAKTPNVRLAGGDPWYVVIDAEDEGESRLIDGEEAEFSEHDHLPGQDRLYYLDFRNAESPKLWINRDHSRIVDLLHADGSVGAEARMRDVVLDQIQGGVWPQLIVRAAADVDEEGEPRHEWEEAVLNIFARDLTNEDDTTEAAIQLREDLKDPENVAVLMERIDGSIQDYIDPRDQLIDLVEEGLRL